MEVTLLGERNTDSLWSAGSLKGAQVPDSASVDEIDLSPVLAQDPLDLRVTLTALVHWADSNDVRLLAMRLVNFPVNDMRMFLVVNQLTYRGALRPTDLASVLGTTPANISKIVRRLEDEGLVVRTPSPTDERSVLVALTAEGRAIGHRIAAESARRFAVTFAGWTDDEIDTFRRLVFRFSREAIHELAARSPGLAFRDLSASPPD